MRKKIDHCELKKYIHLMRKFEKKADRLACMDKKINFLELKKYISLKRKFEKKADRLLLICGQSECLQCGRIVCILKDPMHFHHDGCPSC